MALALASHTSHLPLFQSLDSHRAVSTLTHAGLTTILMFCPQLRRTSSSMKQMGEKWPCGRLRKGKHQSHLSLRPAGDEPPCCSPHAPTQRVLGTHITHTSVSLNAHMVTANSGMERYHPLSYPHLFPVRGWGRVHGKIVKLSPEEPVTTQKHSHLEPFCLWLQQMGQARADTPQGVAGADQWVQE